MNDGPIAGLNHYPHVRHRFEGDTNFLLVRHGRTEANSRHVLQGRSDFPLDSLGLRQAALIAERIAALPPVEALVASPLLRARTTADIIGKRIGMEPVFLSGLAEMSFGDLEGHSYDEIAIVHPELFARMADIEDHDVGWPGGETRREFATRVMTAFNQLMDDYRLHRIAVVAHGGVLGSFLGQILGRPQGDPSLYDIANCRLTEVRVTAAHTVISLRNDIGHLAPIIDAAEEWL